MAAAAGLAKKFNFVGSIPASKSLMNRALIAKSFAPNLDVRGQSACADVQHMLQAVHSFPAFTQSVAQSSPVDCGEAGTVFRFMALRASRQAGPHQLRGTRRLLERPQQALIDLLRQLSVTAHLSAHELTVDGSGWKKPAQPIVIQREKSSQFSTGLVMSAWDLPFDLEFQLLPAGISDSYWNMTLSFARSLGMQIEAKGNDHFLIPAGQKVRLPSILIEPDYSSAFAVAAAAALFGQTRLQNFVSPSLQPDFAFVELMKKMNVPISLEQQVLTVTQAKNLRGGTIPVRETPDLFPVLAVLCAFAEGESRLVGAPRLAYKESNRIQKTAELLRLLQVENQPLDDGIVIQGQGAQLKPRAFVFDPDQDHRMAMAAGILLKGGWDIQVKTPEIVNKSFPEFWQILGVQP